MVIYKIHTARAATIMLKKRFNYSFNLEPVISIF